jgi:glycosidase
MGMWGGDDPDCRKPLWWPDYQFEAENRNNIQKIEAVYDEVGFNQEVFDFYKKLIQIRNDHELLHTAPINFVVAEGKWLSYKRSIKDEEILVCFNVGEAPATFKLDRGKTYNNLLDETSVTYTDTIDLPPLTAVILLRK